MFFVYVKKNVNLHVPDKLHCGWWQAAFAGAPGPWGGRSPPLSMSVPKWLHWGPLLDNYHSLLRGWWGRGAEQSTLLCLCPACMTGGMQLPLQKHLPFRSRFSPRAILLLLAHSPVPFAEPSQPYILGRAALTHGQSTHCFGMSQISLSLPLASDILSLF